uniref:CRP-I 5 n=2 Tax=Mytilus galloprovincialis TaxID=29158 RepID=A0A0A7ACT7_MYTGA|nr:CRP-I 5 [Mytilus galloprovincialis]
MVCIWQMSFASQCWIKGDPQMKFVNKTYLPYQLDLLIILKRRMKISVFLVVCMLIMSVGVTMAKDEMLEDNGLIHNRIKRYSCWPRKCYTRRDCCSSHLCISGWCTGRKG